MAGPVLAIQIWVKEISTHKYSQGDPSKKQKKKKEIINFQTERFSCSDSAAQKEYRNYKSRKDGQNSRKQNAED